MTKCEVYAKDTEVNRCSEECGYYRIRIVPFKYLSEKDRASYEQTGEDNIVFFKPEDPYKLYADAELYESKNGALEPELTPQDCYVARVELVEKLIETIY